MDYYSCDVDLTFLIELQTFLNTKRETRVLYYFIVFFIYVFLFILQHWYWVYSTTCVVWLPEKNILINKYFLK